MKKQKRISFGYIRNDMNEIVIYGEQAEVVWTIVNKVDRKIRKAIQIEQEIKGC